MRQAARGRFPARLVRRIGAFAIAVVVAGAAAGAQDAPALKGPVTDLANVIDPAQEATLDQRIRALQSASGDAVVVLTVPTYAPFGSVEELAVKVFERAGIGARGQDNGVLIVLALGERRVKIETGYGVEEFITDGFAGETIRQVMLPAFREGRYGEGLLAGTTRIIQRLADRRGVTLADLPAETRPARSARPPSLVTIIIGVIVLIAIINMIRRSGGGPSIRRGGWPGQTWSGWHGGSGGFGGGGFGGGFGGGGRGGGFGGFGGGRSGGGGASGGW